MYWSSSAVFIAPESSPWMLWMLWCDSVCSHALYPLHEVAVTELVNWDATDHVPDVQVEHHASQFLKLRA